MFGTWSVITPSWLSGSWRSFLYSSSLYSCHLFLISSASIRSNTTSVLYWAYLTWNVPFVSLIFFKRFLVFPILLFCSISLHQSLRKDFLSLLGILWNSSFRWIYFSFPPLLFTSLLFSAILSPPQTTFCLFAFLFLGDGLDPCLQYNVTNLHP